MKQYKFKIEYEGKFSYSWGYALYSAFLEQLKEETAEEIHSGALFNQYNTPNEWIVNTEKDFMFKDQYFLHKYNTEIWLKEMSVDSIREQQFADRHLVNQPYKKNIRLNFLTPTTFKQDGAYVLYPTKDLMMQSLTNKWNQWAKTFVLEDVEWNNCKISKYKLRSLSYNLKEIRIQGFVGSVDLFFWGSESMIRLGNMICDFSNYSGIGIKTTLGMGGAKVE